MTEAQQHFMRLASAGSGTGPSNGEAKACRLAWSLVENVVGLDEQAVVGACAFARWCRADPCAALDWLEMNGRPCP